MPASGRASASDTVTGVTVLVPPIMGPETTSSSSPVMSAADGSVPSRDAMTHSARRKKLSLYGAIQWANGPCESQWTMH